MMTPTGENHAVWDRRRPVGIALSRRLIGLLLGGAGYVGYFVSTAFAVQLAGAAVPPVIIGTMPVFLAIIANFRDRSAPWRSLAPPLPLIAAGVATLVIWIADGLANGAVMRSADAPDGLQWTGVQEVGAAIGSLLLPPLASFDLADTASISEAFRFVVEA